MGILPLTVLRRLDATIAPTNDAVLAKDADLERQVLQNQAIVLERVAGVPHTATSPTSSSSPPSSRIGP